MQPDNGNALIMVHFANSLDEFCIGFNGVADIIQHNIISFGEVGAVEILFGRFFGFVVQGCPGAVDTFADAFRDDYFLVFVIMVVLTDDL